MNKIATVLLAVSAIGGVVVATTAPASATGICKPVRPGGSC
jgi:hypothetical protein